MHYLTYAHVSICENGARKCSIFVFATFTLQPNYMHSDEVINVTNSDYQISQMIYSGAAATQKKINFSSSSLTTNSVLPFL